MITTPVLLQYYCEVNNGQREKHVNMIEPPEHRLVRNMTVT